jgi:hypothetical protein
MIAFSGGNGDHHLVTMADDGRAAFRLRPEF